MARGHGRILSGIWEDEDFLALGEREQRLYLFFISQPNLNHAGLLPLTLRRWARKARGLTAADLEKHLQALSEARFVVIDEDTEELLIRSFVRNDGVWRMPRVMGAMVSGAMEISSKHLRRALLAEMDRIPLHELSDEPTKGRGGEGPSVRRQVADHINDLRKAFGDLDPTPTGGGSGTPSVTPSGTPSDTPAEGGPKASTRGHAGMQARVSPSPSPAPNPSPSPTPSAGVREHEGHPAPVAHEKGTTDQMLNAWWEKYGRRTAQGRKSIRSTIAEALGNGVDPNELWQALTRLGELSKPVTGNTLQFAFAELRAPAQVAAGAENVLPFAAGRRPATSDLRVQQALEAGRRLQALADAQNNQEQP